MTALQRSVGNAAASQLLTEPPHSTPTVHCGGPSVSLHGDTTANYDGGKSNWKAKSIKRATGCKDCPDDDPCVRAIGTFTVTYHADVTIKMPDLPDGLTECQQRRVSVFLRDVLGPHEREHALRFHTYDGTTTHRIDLTGCGRTALQEHLQKIHDTEEAKRTPTPMRCRLPSIRSTGRSISTAINECCCLPELAGSTAIDGTA